MSKKLIILLACLSAVLFLLATGCGDDDDDNDDAEDAVNDDADDDVDDDIDDDVNDDVNDDVDDDVDDDTEPVDPDTEYDSLACASPDPESLGEGIMVGGGPAADTIHVYVYDDKDCSPVEGATVIAGDIYQTDADGFVEINTAKASTRVTAYKESYQVWTYEADAAVMYFRLKPTSYEIDYGLSDYAYLTEGGVDLDFDNPVINTVAQILTLITDPVYAGLAMNGLSRQTLMSYDPAALFTEDSVRINIFAPTGDFYMDIYMNIIVPSFVVNGVLGITVQMPNRDFYQLPVAPGDDPKPIAGLMLEARLGNVLTLETLTAIIEAFVETGDQIAMIAALAGPLLRDGITIPYVGLDPGTWTGSGAPDLEVMNMTDSRASFDVTLDSVDAEADYLSLLVAEIPNRSLAPISLDMPDEAGVMNLAYADVIDADYILAAAKTDILKTDLDSNVISFAFQYSPFHDTWAEGIGLADSEFLPYFDEETAYDHETKEVTWTLNATVDAYVLLALPAGEESPSIIATLPGTATGYTIPDEVGFVAAAEDMVLLLGVDLPDGVDTNNWNPHGFMAYDSAHISVWMNLTVLELLNNLMIQ